jgi:hypothetical protein
MELLSIIHEMIYDKDSIFAIQHREHFGYHFLIDFFESLGGRNKDGKDLMEKFMLDEKWIRHGCS